MSEYHIEDKVLELKEKTDPDDCQNCISIDAMQGCEDVVINVRGIISDTGQWSGRSIFLDRSRVEVIRDFLTEHLNLLDKTNTVGKGEIE